MSNMNKIRIFKFFGRHKASVVLSFVLIIFILNITPSNSFKTMNTLRRHSKHSKEPVSTNKFPFGWKLGSSKKTSALAAIAKSADGCPGGSSTSTTSSKCRKQKKQQKTVNEKPDKEVKTKNNFISTVFPQQKIVPPEIPKSLMNVNAITPENILEINRFVKEKRHYCKLKKYAGFSCKKLKFSMWLAKQMESDNTKLNDWLDIVRRAVNETEVKPSSKALKDIKPDIWPEKVVYRLIRAWGDPEDLFVFYKYKDFIKSRELKISLPFQAELKVSPISENELVESARSSLYAVDTARFFWDPGFNLKLKLPFFRDELKVAVSTGPSFVAGIGVGIALLILKSMFAPMLFGAKWMMYNLFFKESSPFELMKMLFLSHAPDAWDSNIPPPSIEHYHPPPVHNPFDHPPRGRPPPPLHHPPFRPPFGHRPKGPPPPHHHHPHYGPHSGGPGPYDLDYYPSDAPPPFDLKHQYTQATPAIQSAPEPTMSQLEHLYRQQLIEEGLGITRPYKSLLPPDPTNSIDVMGEDPGMHSMDFGMETDPHDSQSYIPSTGLQAEVEHFDPFYSPLLSKVDSIFTHLGHDDEGCRERVVCSIYKFPVKYAPYSNLISAQLSKHQSELKRPVTSSAKILRYFRYMKAAKDGQGGESCVDLYPKCNSDTDAVSSLPMITTFHQLSELMTAEPSSPASSFSTVG